jgi:hypothetical protein
MNEHLQPVFEILLPELERRGIKYWVYGGVGIVAVARKFFRHNTDVDIFVEEPDFVETTSRLGDKCKEKGLTSKLIEGRRPKFEVRAKRTDKDDILSVVPVYRKDGPVEFIFGRRSATYPDEIIDRIWRNIGDYEFFTPPDKWIKELFKTYVRNRPGKKKCEKVQKDAQKILTLEERRELEIPELTRN